MPGAAPGGAWNAEKVAAAFRSRFGADPSWLVRSPGRVNLIGEHTDYNEGFVLPMAIDRAVWIALRARSGRDVVAASLDFAEEKAFSLDGLRREGQGWWEYLKGTAWALGEAGDRLAGWEGVLAGDVPIGAGLSSSAALEMAAARAFTAVSGRGWDPVAMAKLARRAENEWVGVGCGIMDPLIIGAGREGHATLIDCRSLEMRPAPLPRGTVVAVLDTSTRRELTGSAYNERRAQCEEAARALGVKALRDVTSSELEARGSVLRGAGRRRARHIVTENARTIEAAEAMEAGDARRLGRLMNESHASMRDDFEISTPALDAMVESAQSAAGCYGARMTGGGFGGCVVALVDEASAPAFLDGVARSYHRRTGLTPSLYLCRPESGVSMVRLRGE
ncbi:MAG TPA: galactokinase [Vicinamibacteria bacterium]